jgi:carbon-monoxide dehydrogenase small subunit
VRHGLEGNLCRCTGYHNIVRAVLDAAKTGQSGTVEVPAPSQQGAQSAEAVAQEIKP